MKNLRIHCIYPLFAVFFVFLFISCNKKEELGLEVQPLEDRITIGFDRDFGLTAYSIREDSIRTDKTLVNLMGSYHDPIMGVSTAGFYVQFRLPTTNLDFGVNPALDSIVLSLTYSGGYYGDLSTRQHVNVYEVLEDFSSDSSYYSNDRLYCSSTDLSGQSFIPKPADSITLGGLRFAPQLRIKLDQSLGQKFITASGTPALTDNPNFLQFFKGLYIIAQSQLTKGAMLYFSLLNSQSKITLYYHNDEHDSLTQSFIIDDKSARFNTFDHRAYSGSDIGFQHQIAGDTSRGNTILYLQAMAGVKTFIRLPDLSSILNNGNVVINKAELVITPDASAMADFKHPEQLTLARLNLDNTLSFVPDQYYGSNYFGGTYNSATKQYRFNLAVFIQDVVKDNLNAGKGLFISISGASVKGDRLVFYGPANPQGNLRLEITYTNLN